MAVLVLSDFRNYHFHFAIAHYGHARIGRCWLVLLRDVVVLGNPGQYRFFCVYVCKIQLVLGS